VKETPLSFLIRKGFTILCLPIWNTAYRINATRLGNLALHDLSSDAFDLPCRGVGPAEVPGEPGYPWPPNYDGAADVLRRTDPRYVESLRARADRAAAHSVPVLGFGELDIGTPIDWHRDHTTGARWPSTAALRLDYVRPMEQSDVKVPWEVNRLQFLPWLGQAWLLSGDITYVSAASDIMKDWANSNPVGVGIAWSCPMDVAIRGINLRVALLMLGSGFDDPTKTLVLRLLRVHLSFLRRHPELSDINGNHYLINLAGIVQLGLATTIGMPKPPWLSRAITTFTAETLRQTHADGVHIEHSTNYHRLITDVVLSTLVELGRAGHPVPDLSARAESMVDFLAQVAGPDGRIPLFGDSDSGQLHILGQAHANDVRPLLALGALLFDRPDLRTNVSDLPHDVVWQLGPGAVAAWHAQPSGSGSSSSRVFRDGGFVVLGSADSKVVTRCGSPGLRGRGGHDHSDLTSFTAVLEGVPLLIDTGS